MNYNVTMSIQMVGSNVFFFFFFFSVVLYLFCYEKFLNALQLSYSFSEGLSKTSLNILDLRCKPVPKFSKFIDSCVGWLVVLAKRPFEIIFQSIWGRL